MKSSIHRVFTLLVHLARWIRCALTNCKYCTKTKTFKTSHSEGGSYREEDYYD